MTAGSGTLSAKTVWGKVVLFLKEHRQVALHVACGDITDVELGQSSLIVRVRENMLNQLLTDGRREIESALRWQGLDLSLQIEYTPPQLSGQEQDIEKLKKIAGEYLKIK